jgi:hypothetical protein
MFKTAPFKTVASKGQVHLTVIRLCSPMWEQPQMPAMWMCLYSWQVGVDVAVKVSATLCPVDGHLNRNEQKCSGYEFVGEMQLRRKAPAFTTHSSVDALLRRFQQSG